MTTTPGISRIINDGNQRLLRVTRSHAISEDWLHEHTPELLRAWRHASTAAERDQIAASIDDEFDNLETDGFADVISLDPPSPSTVLRSLIDDYETHLIATANPRTLRSVDRAAIERHANAHTLDHSTAMVELRLRDWAESAAPALLERWQRDVVAAGAHEAGAAAMRAIAAAKHWAHVLRAIDPHLAGKTALPRLAETLERARLGGHPLESDLPRLATGLRRQDPVGELTRRIVRACEDQTTPPHADPHHVPTHSRPATAPRIAPAPRR